MNKFLHLVRRELWEARSVWMAPAILAAPAAGNRAPPIPASGGPGSNSASAASIRRTISGSAPHNRSSPSSCTSIRPKPGAAGSSSAATAGLKPATRSRAAFSASPSASGSGSRNSASGASLCAAPSGIPGRTPSSNAHRLASRTGPSVHGRPPKTIGAAPNGLEDLLRANLRRRWGQ